jgi:hypothetical protein
VTGGLGGGGGVGVSGMYAETAPADVCGLPACSHKEHSRGEWVPAGW